jgi:hypothetical protein
MTREEGGSIVIMTRHTVSLPGDLWAELQAKSEAEGKTIEVLAEEALRKGLADRSWQELPGYGAECGHALGFREEQAADGVHAWRAEKHRAGKMRGMGLSTDPLASVLYVLKS